MSEGRCVGANSHAGTPGTGSDESLVETTLGRPRSRAGGPGLRGRGRGQWIRPSRRPSPTRREHRPAHRRPGRHARRTGARRPARGLRLPVLRSRRDERPGVVDRHQATGARRTSIAARPEAVGGKDKLMGRRARPKKGKADAKRPLARRPPKDDRAKIRDLEKRLAAALEREAEAVKREAEARGQLQTRDRELVDAREQQAATSEILNVISRSPSDVQPV